MSGERNDEEVRVPSNMETRYVSKKHRAIKYNDESLIQSGATARALYEDGRPLPEHTIEPHCGRK